MWLDWWGPPILLLLYLCPTQSQPVAQFGMCQARCLKEYANKKDRRLNNGDVVLNELDIANNTQFSLCKLGCSVSGFSELDLPAFLVGQSTAKELSTKTEDVIPLNVVTRLQMLCADYVALNRSINGQLLLQYNNVSNDYFVHFVEAFYRSGDGSKAEKMFWSTYGYSKSIDANLVLPADLTAIQFRVTTFSTKGVMGNTIRGPWFPGPILEQTSTVQLSTSVKNQMWSEEQAAVELHFAAPAGSIPACSLTLAYDASVDDLQIPFVLDRSSGYLVDSLLFEHDYRVQIRATSRFVRDQDGAEETLVRTSSCRKLAKDPSMCAPSPAENIQWGWVGQDAIVLNWTLPNEQETQVFHRGVHFSISMRTIPTSGPQCPEVPEQKRSVTGTHRSVQLYPSDGTCNYEIEVVVVDTRNRRSTPTKVQIYRYEKASSLIIGAAARDWAQIGMLFVMLTVVLISVAAAVTVCVRSRRLSIMQKDLGKALRQSVVTGTICTNDSGSEQWCQINGKQVVGLRSGYLDSDEESQKAIQADLNRKHFSATLPRPPNMEPPQIHYVSSFRGVHSLRRPNRQNFSALPQNGAPAYASDVSRLADQDGYTRFYNQNLISPESMKYASLPIMDAVLPATIRIPSHQIDMVEYLGSGKFSLKSLVAVRQERDYVRVLQKQAIGGDHLRSSEVAIRRELRAAQAMNSNPSHSIPSILGFLGVVVDPAAEAELVSGLLFEHCQGGDFLSYLHVVNSALSQANQSNPNNIYEDVYCIEQKNMAVFLSQCCQDVVSGVKYISECGFLHRDIGAHSIYLHLPWQDAFMQPHGQRAKIASFELCEPVRLGTIDDDGEGLNIDRLPPETHDDGIYTKESDLWQLGEFLYEVCTLGRPAALQTNLREGREERVQREIKRMHSGAKDIDVMLAEPMRPLITECLNVGMAKRPTAAVILQFLEKLLPPKVLRTESFYV
ncbi:unnamed protein product, partial [Mesorhabditis spiculigera]